VAKSDSDKGSRKKSDSSSGSKGGKNRSDKNQKYTDPDLREKLKEKIKAGTKGGRAGQWSARKSQLLVHEYEKQGGGYTSSKRTKSQKSLEEWTDEEWTTRDGKQAERDGKMHRYLPKEAWDKLSPAEKKAADAKKVKGDDGEVQYVPNTEAAKKARRDAKKSGGKKSGGKSGGKKSGGKKSSSKGKSKKSGGKKKS
jgi:hypothetical protein